MATNFPTSLDTLTNPTASDPTDNPSHAGQHANANDAIEAIQAKVGINGSAVTTSHDYKLSTVTGSDKAVGASATQTLTNKTFNLASNTLQGTLAEFSTAVSDATLVSTTGTETLTNKTLGTGTAIDLGSDATGDLLYRNSDGDLARLAIGSAGQTLQVSGGLPAWSTASVSLADQAMFIPNITGDDSGTVATIYSDQEAIVNANISTTFFLMKAGQKPQKRAITSDWASADTIRSVVLLGSYVYVLMEDDATGDVRVYRYEVNDLSAGGTQMSFTGAVTLATSANTLQMTSDGTNFFITHQAGNSANDYVLSEYSVSGTTFTYVADTTCGSTGGYFDSFMVFADGNIYALDTATAIFYKFNSSGTLQYTSDVMDANMVKLYNWQDNAFTIKGIESNNSTQRPYYERIFV